MRHISAFALVVPDYDAAIAFYVGGLGWTLIDDTPQGPNKRWVLVAPDPAAQTRVLLARAADPTQAQAIGNQTGGRVGFFLHSDDFDADLARLRAAGAILEDEPRQEPYGRVTVWRDPFGNRWDLLGA